MSAEPEINELLGLFDVPAFARRGIELEYRISRLHERCRRARDERLEMIRVRLRQWAAAASGPEDWTDCFHAPLDDLLTVCAAEPPPWSGRPAPLRRRRGIARDLRASVL